MSNTVLSPDFAESFKAELTETTEEAMKIAGVLKESDLSQYIPYGDGSLSEELFIRLQKTDQKKCHHRRFSEYGEDGRLRIDDHFRCGISDQQAGEPNGEIDDE